MIKSSKNPNNNKNAWEVYGMTFLVPLVILKQIEDFLNLFEFISMLDRMVAILFSPAGHNLEITDRIFYYDRQELSIYLSCNFLDPTVSKNKHGHRKSLP